MSVGLLAVALAACAGGEGQDAGAGLSRLTLDVVVEDSIRPASAQTQAVSRSHKPLGIEPLDIVTVEIWVRASDLSDPIFTALDASSPSEVTVELTVPMGPARDITVKAFNALGAEIFTAHTVVDLTQELQAVNLMLEPVLSFNIVAEGTVSAAEGGTLTAHEHETNVEVIRLVVSPGALASDVTIQLGPVNHPFLLPPLPSTVASVGPVLMFEPSGTVFDPPATLTVAYDPLELQEVGLKPADLHFYTLEDGATVWQELDVVVDTVTSTVTASLTGFSAGVIGGHPSPNQPPVAQSGSRLVGEGTPLLEILSASDADGDPLTFSIVDPPTKGTVVLTNSATGEFTYTPNPGALGLDSFTFKANDGLADSNVTTMQLDILLLNVAFNDARRAGSTVTDQGQGIAPLVDGGVVVTGFFGNNATFGPGETNQTTLTTNTSKDLFVARFNPDGTLVWVREGDSSSGSDTVGTSVASFGDDSSVVTGFFDGTTRLGAGEPGQIDLVSAGAEDVFIARYRSDGSLDWAIRVGDSGSQEGFGVASFDDGSFVVTGVFNSAPTFGSGETTQTTLVSAGNDDVFVARYNADGTLAWARRAGGSDFDEGTAVTTLGDGSVVVTGFFRGTATFGPGEANQTVLTSAGLDDGFVARYDANGNLMWVTPISGSKSDVAQAVDRFSDDAVVVSGFFGGTASFGPGDPNPITLTAVGGGNDSDYFLARYEADGTLRGVTQVGGTAPDIDPTTVGVSRDNTVIFAGTFQQTVTFGIGEPTPPTLTSAGLRDLFVSRYHQDGILRTVTRDGDVKDDLILGVAVLADGSAAVTGSFEQAVTFGASGSNPKTLTSAGLADILLAHYGR